MSIITQHINEFLTAIIAAFGGSFFGWFFTRKKQEADTESTEIDNRGKMIELYQKTLDDLEKRYEEKFIELKESYQNRHTEMKEMYDLKIQSLNQKIEILKKDHEDCMRNHEQLKKEIKSK